MTFKTFCDVCDSEITGTKVTVRVDITHGIEEFRHVWHAHESCRHAIATKLECNL